MKILPCILALFHLLGGSLIAADKPNIIMILADDVGLGNLGCTGGPFKTPHLDALAKGGTLFSHCFAMPQCSPSRCTLLTGRYSFRTGLLGNQAAQDELLKATYELTKNLEMVKKIVRKSLTGTATPLT